MFPPPSLANFSDLADKLSTYSLMMCGWLILRKIEISRRTFSCISRLLILARLRILIATLCPVTSCSATVHDYRETRQIRKIRDAQEEESLCGKDCIVERMRRLEQTSQSLQRYCARLEITQRFVIGLRTRIKSHRETLFTAGSSIACRDRFQHSCSKIRIHFGELAVKRWTKFSIMNNGTKLYSTFVTHNGMFLEMHCIRP